MLLSTSLIHGCQIAAHCCFQAALYRTCSGCCCLASWMTSAAALIRKGWVRVTQGAGAFQALCGVGCEASAIQRVASYVFSASENELLRMLALFSRTACRNVPKAASYIASPCLLISTCTHQLSLLTHSSNVSADCYAITLHQGKQSTTINGQSIRHGPGQQNFPAW